MMTQLQNLLISFNNCDKDGDNFLNEKEFLEFCTIGLRKPTDPEMYFSLCQHLGADKRRGLSWNEISIMLQASNSGSQQQQQKQQYAQLEKKQYVQLEKKQSSNKVISHVSDKSISRQSDESIESDIRLASPYFDHSHTNSMTNIPEGLELLDDMSDTSDFSGTRYSRTRPSNANMIKRESSTEKLIVDMINGTNEETQKKLREVTKKQKKLKNINKNLEKEIEQLREQNRLYNRQIMSLQQDVSQLKENKENLKHEHDKHIQKLKKENELLKTQLNDDRKTITHLQGQYNLAVQERDQVLILFKNAEAKFENQINNLKTKHKDQLEKVSVGFLQSLGVEPGKDVRQSIRELREEKKSLKTQVDMLAEQLTRKDHSLYEALQAVDILSQSQGGFTNPMLLASYHESNKYPFKESESLNKPANDIFTLGVQTKTNNQSQPPQSNPTFFIEATSGSTRRIGYSQNVLDSNVLDSISKPINSSHEPSTTEGKVKQYQFIANKMSNEVVKKEQEIENLRLANTVLGDQINIYKHQEKF